MKIRKRKLTILNNGRLVNRIEFITQLELDWITDLMDSLIVIIIMLADAVPIENQ